MSDYLTPEEEQAEEDAALARAEHDAEEARDRARVELLEHLARGVDDTSLAWACVLVRRDARLLVDWIRDMQRRIEAQQFVLDSIADQVKAPF